MKINSITGLLPKPVNH